MGPSLETNNSLQGPDRTNQPSFQSELGKHDVRPHVHHSLGALSSHEPTAFGCPEKLAGRLRRSPRGKVKILLGMDK